MSLELADNVDLCGTKKLNDNAPATLATKLNKAGLVWNKPRPDARALISCLNLPNKGICIPLCLLAHAFGLSFSEGTVLDPTVYSDVWCCADRLGKVQAFVRWTTIWPCRFSRLADIFSDLLPCADRE